MTGIALDHISKRFDRVVALDSVSIRVTPGRVHGILGENGAGKSTLMNVLYGLVRPDAGRIEIDGRPIAIRSPRDAIRHGIGMVHQHFMLADAMTVLDNVLLGDMRQAQWLNRRAAADALRRLAGDLEMEVDPYARICDLSVGQQQRVEILKALHRDAQVLILDEPTAVLTPPETDQLLKAMSRLRDQGRSVIFISHKLGEVVRICDDLTVLRRGRVAWEGPAQGATAEELADRMVGARNGEFDIHRVESAPSASVSGNPIPVLQLADASTSGLHGVSLHVGREILGIAGVDGNGQQELAELVVGLRRTSGGTIHLGKTEITRFDAHTRAELGIGHIPNDRKREGLVAAMSVAENTALKHHRRAPFSRRGIISWRRTRQLATRLTGEFDIRAASVDVPVANLSGGNQQKVVLARELAVASPKLIVAVNPTRGLDIAATAYVHEQLIARRNAGCGILLISSELDELMTLANRIGVLYRGRLTMTPFPNTTVESIGRLMAGLS